MIGDPPNIIIGNGLEEYIGFVDFIVALAPAVLIMAIPALFLLRFLFKGALTGRLEKYDEVRLHAKRICGSYPVDKCLEWFCCLQFNNRFGSMISNPGCYL